MDNSIKTKLAGAAGAVLKAATLDATTLTRAGLQLKQAGEAAARLPMGAERAKAFGTAVLPVLLGDVSKLIGGDRSKLLSILSAAVAGAGSSEPTLGLRREDSGAAADTDYPPRAANALWPDFAAALGISKGDVAAVTELNTAIGACPKAEGKYAPDVEQLGPELQALATKVSRSLLGEDVGPLTPRETAFKANLALINLTWHMTNWQRASGDASRVDPLARNNVFNTYSDNLKYAYARGGLDAVIDMAISDAYNAGKPGVGKASFAQPKSTSLFQESTLTKPSQRNALAGGLTPAAERRVPARDVYGGENTLVGPAKEEA